MKTLYHGTIMEYAEKIKREGLREMPSQVIHAAADHWLLGEIELQSLRDSGIDTTKPHVTKRRDKAEYFAQWRAQYTKAKVGDRISAPTLVTARKSGGEPPRDAVPALVTVTVPNNWKLEDDIQMEDSGYISPLPIPAKYISAIEAL